MQYDDEAYRVVHSGPSEASGEVGADGVNFQKFLEHQLLWDQSKDTEEVTKKEL